MDNQNQLDTQETQKPRTLRIFVIIFIVILVIIMVGTSILIGIQIGRNQVIKTNTQTSALDISPAPTTPSPSPQLRTDLPTIKVRNITHNKNIVWNEFFDTRGYGFSYPSTWFLSRDQNEVQQIQNWNPETNSRLTTPLSGSQSKWDVSFRLEEFSSVDEVLSRKSEKIKIDTIEKSITKTGSTIYFIQGTDSFFGQEDERDPVIFAIVEDSGKFFTWTSIYSGDNKVAEILKEIVESLHK